VENKPTGFDALWVSIGTIVDEKVMVNLTDLYIERGPDVAWSGIGWELSVATKHEDGAAPESGAQWEALYSHRFDIDLVPGEAPPRDESLATTELEVAMQTSQPSSWPIGQMLMCRT